MSLFGQQSGRMYAVGFALLAVFGGSILLLGGGATGCILGGCTLVGCGPSEIRFISDRGASVDPGDCSVSVRLGEEQVDFAVGESEGHGALTGLTARRSPSGVELEPTGRFSHGPIEVTVTTAKGEARQTIEPKWQTSTPNGDACPPECVSMDAAMSIPLSIVVSRKPPNDLIELSVVVPDDTDPLLFEGPDLDAIGLRKFDGTITYVTEVLSNTAVENPEALLGAPDMVSKDGTCLTGGGFVDFGVDSILTVRVDGELETGDELIVYDSSLCATDAPASYELLLCMVGGYGLPNCFPGITGRGQTRLKAD